MRNTQFVKTFVAEGAITKRRIVKAGTADGQVAQAAAVTDELIGIADTFDSADTEHVDVHLHGVVPTECGAAISYGARISCDADGKAIAVALATDKHIGIAMSSTTAAGQLVDILIDRSV